jgi:hypothetical protein
VRPCRPLDTSVRRDDDKWSWSGGHSLATLYNSLTGLSDMVLFDLLLTALFKVVKKR